MTTLILVIAISLGISFVCSILEAVLLSISHSYVAILEERGHPAGALLSRMRSVSPRAARKRSRLTTDIDATCALNIVQAGRRSEQYTKG